MKLGRLVLRNLEFYWRTNIAIIAGVAAAIAVLAGAMLVGQSVRGSLRRLLYERIGTVDSLVTADRFFSEDLTQAFSGNNVKCPIIRLSGVVTQEQTGIRVHNVNVYGVDERFWKFQNLDLPSFQGDRDAWIGSALAGQLGAGVGDGLLLTVETQQDIPREWLYGRRDNLSRTVRLNCRAVLPSSRLGEFALRPSQGNVYSIFVPMQRLQKDLGQPSRVNAILLAGRSSNIRIDEVRASIKQHCTLGDLGLALKPLTAENGFSLECKRVILDDAVAAAASQAAASLGLRVSPVYTYLANSIRANGREIPYSAIAAADLGAGALTFIKYLQPSLIPAIRPGESIWLTDWAQKDLDVSQGATVEIEYYAWQDDGKLATRTARFRLAGVVATAGDVNSGLSPEIPGITESRSISDWDPPFPLELNRIRREDEEYWDRYRATPKAFISLAKGQELWQTRFGKLTALRMSPPTGADPGAAREAFTKAFLDRLNPQQAGFEIVPVRQQGLAASQGSTDFGEYFLYFSSFLIAAAILLSSLFFKLMTEQRAHEIGILIAAGFSSGKLRRMFLLEGAVLIFAGCLLGLLGALGYGWFMLFGLRNFWAGAVGTQRLYLNFSWRDLLIGAACGAVFSLGAMIWTLRDLRRNSPRSLLSGILESMGLRRKRARNLGIVSIVAFLAAGMLITCAVLGIIAQLTGFFGAGFLLLIAVLCATGAYLRRANPNPILGNGWPAHLRLALRNAMHRPGRSLLCASLIASATFIIVSMEAFRLDERSISLDRKSGTGGYAFVGQSEIPVIHNLNGEAGRESAGISATEFPELNAIAFTAFRERAGDDASCLNLYAPQEPRILGAPRDFLEAGRFAFQSSLASTPVQERNPWLMLDSLLEDGTIPAIADANTIQYILHLSLGSEIRILGSSGKPIRLRLVAALNDSIFQGELIISESNFLRIFPGQEGYRFFLLDVPSNNLKLVQMLKERLSDWGFNVESSRDRLAAYHRVENTYLSTFQALGSLGLILGTIGLAAILLRNVLERRQELALLRAVGYRKSVLTGITLAENVILILWGLAAGTICALLAIMPAVHTRGGSIPLVMTGLILSGVLAAGLLSSMAAAIAASRSPLLAALRSE